MGNKPSVSMTPEKDGFAGRYDRMVERSGSWAIGVGIGIVILVIVIGLIIQLAS